jgi:hypothetical protein
VVSLEVAGDEMTSKVVADLTRCLVVDLNQKRRVEERKESPRMGQPKVCGGVSCSRLLYFYLRFCC